MGHVEGHMGLQAAATRVSYLVTQSKPLGKLSLEYFELSRSCWTKIARCNQKWKVLRDTARRTPTTMKPMCNLGQSQNVWNGNLVVNMFLKRGIFLLNPEIFPCPDMWNVCKMARHVFVVQVFLMISLPQKKWLEPISSLGGSSLWGVPCSTRVKPPVVADVGNYCIYLGNW